jgi:hypothetical protein
LNITIKIAVNLYNSEITSVTVKITNDLEISVNMVNHLLRWFIVELTFFNRGNLYFIFGGIVFIDCDVFSLIIGLSYYK